MLCATPMMAKMEKDRLGRFQTLGHEAGHAERAMSHLALAACQEAIDGRIGADDAEDIYKSFRTARQRASDKPKEAELASLPQQVSKFRRCIDVAKFGEAGADMIERTMALHMRDLRYRDASQLRYSGEYNGIIEICREAIKRGRPLTDAEIVETLTK